MIAAVINTDLNIGVLAVWHSHSTFHKNEGWTPHSAVGIICSISCGLWPVKLAEIRLRSAWKGEFACCPLILKQSLKTEYFPQLTPNCYDEFIFIRCAWLAERSESVPYALHAGFPRIGKDRPNQWRPFVAGQTSGSTASIRLMKTPQSGQLFISLGWSVGG